MDISVEILKKGTPEEKSAMFDKMIEEAMKPWENDPEKFRRATTPAPCSKCGNTHIDLFDGCVLCEDGTSQYRYICGRCGNKTGWSKNPLDEWNKNNPWPISLEKEGDGMKSKEEKSGSTKFKAGDRVQYTLEMAIETDVQELGDPLNDIFEVIGVPDEDNKFGHVNGYTLKPFNPKAGMVFSAQDDQLILAGDNPRHVERVQVKRPSKDEYYLAIAEQVSKRSTCLRRQYGAVIVRDDVIVSTGYNGSPRGEKNCCDKGYCIRQLMNVAHNSGSYDECHSAHAEQNAIINAARQGSSVLGGTLYLYGYDCIEKKTIEAEPCPICARMIKNAGITRIVKSEQLQEDMDSKVQAKKTMLENVATVLTEEFGYTVHSNDIEEFYADGMTEAGLFVSCWTHLNIR